MPNPPNDTLILKRELVGLFGHMQKIRKELAALNPPGSPDHFGGMSEQLDAIVEATEGATNTIMESMESIDNLMTEARAIAVDNAPLAEIFDKVTDKVNMVFEACSFQDITGQRISKVVKTLKTIEGKVDALILAFGEQAGHSDMAAARAEEPAAPLGADADFALLHGPALPGAAIDQDEIDRLLASFD